MSETRQIVFEEAILDEARGLVENYGAQMEWARNTILAAERGESLYAFKGAKSAVAAKTETEE